MLGSEPINLGDQLEWQDNRLGNAVCLNLTKATRHIVGFQAHGIPTYRVRLPLKL